MNWNVSILDICYSYPRQRSRVWNRSRLSMCVSICVSVGQRSHGWTVWATDLNFSRNIAFDNILDKFEGQGQRSSAPFEKCDFPTFSYGVTYVDCTEPFCHDTWCHVTTRTTSWRQGVTSWHPLTIFWQEYWQRGHVTGGSVNAQAFSS